MRLRILAALLLAAAVAWLVLARTALTGEGTSRLLFGVWRTRDVAASLALGWTSLALAVASCSRTALARFAALNGTLAVCWLLLEVAGLAGVVSYRDLLNPVPRGHVGTVAVPNADVRGVTREDLAAAWGAPSPEIPFRFVTDRRGYRNEPDRAEADVYLLGDSFLVAGLVPWEDTLTASLEDALGRPVAALALNGLSPQAECDLFRESGLSARGKLVVQFLFEGNDLLDSASYGAPDGGEELSLRDRTLVNNLVLRLQRVSQPREAFLALRSGTFAGETWLFRWNRDAFAGYEAESDRILAELDAFRAEIEAQGGSYALVMIPSKIRVLGPRCTFPDGSPLADWRAHCSTWPDTVRAWCAERALPYLDLTGELERALEDGALPWFPGDTHWNATGNRVAAEALADWSPLRDWLATTAEERP